MDGFLDGRLKHQKANKYVDVIQMNYFVWFLFDATDVVIFASVQHDKVEIKFDSILAPKSVARLFSRFSIFKIIADIVLVRLSF